MICDRDVSPLRGFAQRIRRSQRFRAGLSSVALRALDNSARCSVPHLHAPREDGASGPRPSASPTPTRTKAARVGGPGSALGYVLSPLAGLEMPPEGPSTSLRTSRRYTKQHARSALTLAEHPRFAHARTLAIERRVLSAASAWAPLLAGLVLSVTTLGCGEVARGRAVC